MIRDKNVIKILVIFLSFHLVIWTIIPTLTNTNLPLDTIEALAWGSNLDWGFNKHTMGFSSRDFLSNFWKTGLGLLFFESNICSNFFLIVFKFSLESFDNKKLALLSVLLLEGIYFYNFTTPEFNVNVCQLPFWALSVFFTWRCIKFDKSIDYIFLGLSIGLGILSKYLFIYLVIGIKLLFLYLIKKRKKINFLNYLIAGPIVLLILTPHIIWLTENDYITITYYSENWWDWEFFDHLISYYFYR